MWEEIRLMDKIKILEILVSRTIYVVFGGLLMLGILQFSGPIMSINDHEFIIPNLDLADECIDYHFKEEILIGQVCHLENGYMYLYLPDEYYIDHISLVCTAIIEDYLEENSTPEGREEYL
jgi:hypothetical protein